MGMGRKIIGTAIAVCSVTITTVLVNKIIFSEDVKKQNEEVEKLKKKVEDMEKEYSLTSDDDIEELELKLQKLKKINREQLEAIDIKLKNVLSDINENTESQISRLRKTEECILSNMKDEFIAGKDLLIDSLRSASSSVSNEEK